MRRTRILLLGAFAGIWLGSCAGPDSVLQLGGDPNTIEIAGIQIGLPGVGGPSLNPLTLTVGDSLRLVATALDAVSNIIPAATITWSSGAPGVANIDTDGTVRAFSPGTTALTASSGDAFVSVQTVVNSAVPQTPALGSIRVTPASTLLASIGEQTQFSAVATDSAGTPLTVQFTWQSRNAAVATVSPSGRATARSNGQAYIVAANACCTVDSGLVTVNVPPPPAALGSIAVTPGTALLTTIGATAQFTATVTDSAGAPLSAQVTWQSTNDAVVTVNSSGLATAVSNGTALVIAANSCCTVDSSLVTVQATPPPPAALGSIVVTPATSLLTSAGATTQFTATVTDSLGAPLGAQVTWQSTNGSVVSVNSAGLATAVSNGTALVIAANACCTFDSSTVTVQIQPPALGAIQINPSTALLTTIGATTQFSATVTDSLGAPLAVPVTWQSTNPAVFTISGAGVATAVSNGTASVVATNACCVVDSATVTVQAAPPPPPALGTIVVNPSSALLTAIGATTQFSAAATDSLGAPLSVPFTWQSTNPAVFTVNSSGRATAVGNGTASIVASNGCCRSDSSTVSVQAPPPPPGTVSFFCDWRGTTGTSRAAIECGGKLSDLNLSGPDSILKVEPKTPAHGFPAAMDNVLRILYGVPPLQTNDLRQAVGDAVITGPQVGETLFGRIYSYYGFQSGDVLNLHHVEIGSPNGAMAFWQSVAGARVASNGTFEHVFNIFSGSGAGAKGFGHSKWQVNTLYRLEWRVERLASTTYRFGVQVFLGDSQTPLWTNADFVCLLGCSGSEYLNTPIGAANVTYSGQINSVLLGQNGADTSDPKAARYIWIGGLALRVSSNVNDWIGPYPVTGSGESN